MWFLSKAIKINNVHSGSRPYLQLFQNGPLQFCSGLGWEPEWEMYFLPPGHKKSTMSNQALNSTSNFSKMVLCSSARVQVGSLSGKCASLPRAIENRECSIRPRTLPWTFCISVKVQVGSLGRQESAWKMKRPCLERGMFCIRFQRKPMAKWIRVCG